jgi:hypothetical protein
VKRGRGLRAGYPDLIPFERTDVLEDLKRFVDAHRLSDFTLSDQVIPTIELIRTEDDLNSAFVAEAVQAGGAAVTEIQLFSTFTDPGLAYLQPLEIVCSLAAADTLLIGYKTTNEVGGAQGVQLADPRGITGTLISGLGGSAAGTALLTEPSERFFVVNLAANTPYTLPSRFCDRIKSLPGKLLTFQAGSVGTALRVNCLYRHINKTLTRK